MVRGFYSTEEVFRGLRAAPDGGWGGAEICFILSYMLTACRQIFFYVVPGILDAVVFLIAMLVPKLDNTANILYFNRILNGSPK